MCKVNQIPDSMRPKKNKRYSRSIVIRFKRCRLVMSRNIVFVPLTFTSDHIETLFEIEELYLPLIRERGLRAYRCPSFRLEGYWIDALAALLREEDFYQTRELIR